MINLWNYFFANKCFLMDLGVIETNLFKELKEIIKKSISKYKYSLSFKEQAF